MIDHRVAGAIEARREMRFGDRHADRVGETLAERPGGGLDAGGFASFGVTGGLGMKLAKSLEVVDGERVTGKVQQRIEQHRAVAVR